MPDNSDDTYTIKGDEELEDMYSRLRFPGFPPFKETQDELDREDRADHEPTAASQASSTED